MKKKGLLWIVAALIAAGGAFFLYQVHLRNTISSVIQEYEAHCEEALADVYSLPDCAAYALSDLSFEVTDCTFHRGISGPQYIVTLQIDCQSAMELDKTEASLLAYEVFWQIPEKFTTSAGNRVTYWDASSGKEYRGQLVYIFVNGQVVLEPEPLKTGSDANGDVIHCPTCGTGWNANHPAGKYVKQNGRCNYCPD